MNLFVENSVQSTVLIDMHQFIVTKLLNVDWLTWIKTKSVTQVLHFIIEDIDLFFAAVYRLYIAFDWPGLNNTSNLTNNKRFRKRKKVECPRITLSALLLSFSITHLSCAGYLLPRLVSASPTTASADPLSCSLLTLTILLHIQNKFVSGFQIDVIIKIYCIHFLTSSETARIKTYTTVHINLLSFTSSNITLRRS